MFYLKINLFKQEVFIGLVLFEWEVHNFAQCLLKGFLLEKKKFLLYTFSNFSQMYN